MFCVLSFRASGGAPSPQTSPYIAPHLHHLGTPGLLDSWTPTRWFHSGVFSLLSAGRVCFVMFVVFFCLFDCFWWSSPCLCGDIGVLILFCVRRFYVLWMDRYFDVYGLFMQFLGLLGAQAVKVKLLEKYIEK